MTKIKSQLVCEPKGKASRANPLGYGGLPAAAKKQRAGATFKGSSEIEEAPTQELADGARWENAVDP